jgi:hypothetical protein
MSAAAISTFRIPSSSGTSPGVINKAIGAAMACAFSVDQGYASLLLECQDCGASIGSFYAYSTKYGARSKLPSGISVHNQMISRKCQQHFRVQHGHLDATKRSRKRPTGHHGTSDSESDDHSHDALKSDSQSKQDSVENQEAGLTVVRTAMAADTSTRREFVPLTVSEYAALLHRPVFHWEAAGLDTMQRFLFDLHAQSAWKREGRRMNQVEESQIGRGEHPDIYVRQSQPMLKVPFQAYGHHFSGTHNKFGIHVDHLTLLSNLLKYHLNPLLQGAKYANGGVEPAHCYY